MASLGARQTVATLRSIAFSSAYRSTYNSRSSLFANGRLLRTSLTGPISSARTLHSGRCLLSATKTQETPQAVQDDGPGPVTTFAELGSGGLVNDRLVSTLVDGMGLQNMTDIQAQTIASCLNGSDVVAQAKTGTGKTLGFLVPTAQRILAESPELQHGRQRAALDIRSLVISPTRELAEQIAAEARRMLRGTGIKVQTGVGGTQKRMHLDQMHRDGCHILVGTPGRLYDLLTDPRSGIAMDKLRTLVLDEADRLLDDGFAPDLIKIHERIEAQVQDNASLQTLMFSATMPREVMDMVRRFMKPKYDFIKTVQDNETPTHERVPQKVVRLAGMENTFPALFELVKRDRQNAVEQGKPFKAMVFFNANSETVLYHELFRNLTKTGGIGLESHPLRGLAMVEMHSRLSQGTRTRNSELFRRSSSAIMFTSDVTARGMDFPDVTHVIQIGPARDRESYIHRLGRTGRAGKEGEGWVFVNPIDEGEARDRLRKLPIKKDTTLQTAGLDLTQDGHVAADVAETLTEAIGAAKRTRLTPKSEAFRAMFGTHQWMPYKADLIDAMNGLSKYGWGLEKPPAIPPSLASKLGIGRHRNLNTDMAADNEILDREAREIEEERRQREHRFNRMSRDSRAGPRDGRGGRGRFGDFSRGDRDRGGRGGSRGSFGRSGGGRSHGGSSRPPTRMERLKPGRQISWD